MRYFIGAILFFTGTGLHSQPHFKTRVPLQPIIVGESFRVEYVAEGVFSLEKFVAPAFSSFKEVAGPEVYGGPGEGS